MRRHVNRLTPDRPRFDGLVPPRPHRPHLLFNDDNAAQRDAAARHEPVFQFVSVFCTDSDFADNVQAVRSESATADEIASKYVRRAGYSRRVMTEIIERVVDYPGDVKPGVKLLASYGVNLELEVSEPTQWPHAKRRGEAAGMLAMLGAGRCCGFQFKPEGKDLCRVKLASDSGTRRYCGIHKQPPGAARGDREAITELLCGMGVALRVQPD